MSGRPFLRYLLTSISVVEVYYLNVALALFNTGTFISLIRGFFSFLGSYGYETMLQTVQPS